MHVITWDESMKSSCCGTTPLLVKVSLQDGDSEDFEGYLCIGRKIAKVGSSIGYSCRSPYENDHRRRQPECDNDTVVLWTDREKLIMHKQQTEIALDAGSRVPRGGAEMSGLQSQTRTAARHSSTEVTFLSKTAGVQSCCGRYCSGHGRCRRIAILKSFHHVRAWTRLGIPILPPEFAGVGSTKDLRHMSISVYDFTCKLSYCRCYHSE